MKTKIIQATVKTLLAILNSRLLNQSPCEYGYINNIDAFSYSGLKSEVKMRPDVTVSTIIAEADAFRSCPIYESGLAVIEDGQTREGTIWDVHELQQQFGAAQPGDDKPEGK